MDELSFFGSNGNPVPVMDDLLDTASPPELSQVQSIDDDESPGLLIMTLRWMTLKEIRL